MVDALRRVSAVVSVNLPLYQIEWMDEHGVNRSALVRELLADHISRSAGYDEEIRVLEGEQADLMMRLASIDAELKGLRRQREEDRYMSEVDELRVAVRNVLLYGDLVNPSVDDVLAALRGSYELPEQCILDVVTEELGCE